MPSKNPSKKALPLKSPLRTLLRSVRLHDPLGVHPTQEQVTFWDSPALARKDYLLLPLSWSAANGGLRDGGSPQKSLAIAETVHCDLRNEQKVSEK